MIDATQYKHYFVAESDGRISSTFILNDATYEGMADSSLIHGEADPHTDWYDNGRVKPRPQMEVEMIGATLVNLPTPSTLHINEATYLCDEPTAELELDQAGTYRICVVSWPFMDKVFMYEQT